MALLAVGLYLALFVIQLYIFPFWGPFTAVDEQLHCYQDGRNFAQYGFTSTALLPDRSTGSAAAQHPYLYNHQPPGPDLLMGLLIRLFGERYRLIRTVLATLFLLGTVTYLRFCRLLELRGYALASLAFLLVKPRTVMHMIDHPAYSPFPLLAFLPVIALHHHHETRQTRWLGLAAATVFLGSNYVLYGPLTMVAMLWILGTAFRILPIKPRELILLLGTMVMAVVLHLFQSLVVLGPPLFAQELWFTVSNRMFGEPTRDELKAFYDSLGFVLYGGHRFSRARFLDAVASTLWVRAYAPLAVALVVVLVVVLWQAAGRCEPAPDTVRRSTLELAKVVVSVVVSVLTPIFMFPAFSSDYGLRGMNEFLLGILALASLSFGFQIVTAAPLANTTRSSLRILLLASVAWVGLAQLHGANQVAKGVATWVRDPAIGTGFSWITNHLGGQVAMTNVDPTVVGFFTKQAALGGCQQASIAATVPDASKCLAHFIRGWPATVPTAPAVYVWFGEGNAFCSGAACVSREELDQRFKRVFAGPSIAVYDVAPASR